MLDLRGRIEGLSPEKRGLLEQRLLQRSRGTPQGASIPKAGGGPHRLSHGQERLWFLEQMDPGSAAYHLAWALRLKGAMNVPALEQALDAIVARHEALRTVFREDEGTPVQIAGPPRPVELRRMDATEETCAEALRTEARRPFDLTRDPMLRAALLRLPAGEHVLLLTLHHIAADGWSRGILLRELSEFYEAFAQGQIARLPELPIAFADFAQWQRQWLESGPMEAQLAYWKRQLAGAPATLDLPLDRPRPAAQSFRGAREFLTFEHDCCAQLRDLAQQEGVTLFMILLAVFQALLYRYSGETDVVVGTPIANRGRVETEGLIGYFVNTVAMRTDLGGEPTFRELLTRVRETAMGAFAHRDLPFEKLIEALKPPRNLSHSPIFQVMFVLHNAPKDALAAPGLTSEVVEVETGASQFDLVMEAVERPRQMMLRLAYNTDLFASATVQRMLGHFETLLRAAANHPDTAISKLPLLTKGEESELLAWNQTAVECPRSTILQLFETQAAKTPRAAAATYGQRKWTYEELDRESSRIAGHLRELGVGRDSLVAVYLDRSLDMLAALLGIWKAGAAYLPLDPSHPPQRIAYILEDAAPVAVLTEAGLRSTLPESRSKVIVLEDLHGSAPSLNDPAGPDGLAYVIYTSGSTGKPKGVAIPHRALTNVLHAMARELGATSEDVLLAITTISFDIAGLELFLPLITGACVAIVSREVASDGVRLAQAIQAARVSILQATPATWQMLADSGWTPGDRLKMVCGGEALPPSLAQRLRTGGRLWNVYGPTETTIWSTAARLSSEGDSLTIGRPLDNTTLYVLDRQRQLVPLGVAGELYIGGAGLAKGYWNRPDLTAEKFVPHPFSPGERLYRTGDLVRRTPDGQIDFLGRIDTQVKIRGFRIELGEIEAVLGQHPGVGRTVAVVREDIPGERTLVAYFEAKGPGPETGELREHLKSELPEYMIPSAFVRLEKLPLTPNGKVDRAALPSPQQQRPDASASFVPPRDPLEQGVAQVWSKILKIKPIGVRDDFFELGGHSLAAVRLLSEIQKLTGKTLPLATLFQASTVEALANILRKEGWAPSWSSLVPIQPMGSKHPLFLIHGAEGNLLLYRHLIQHLGPDQPVYGLQSFGLDGKTALKTTVEDMAAAYVKEIQSVRPHGPYFLGGYCLGGSIAFEMARQLAAQGEEVGLVFMLETYGAAPSRHIPFQHLLHFTQNLWFHAANALSVGSGERWKFIAEKIDIALSRLKIRLNPAQYPHVRLKQVNDRAGDAYVPQPYTGRVAIIRPKAYFAGFATPSLGWSDTTPEGLEIHELPVYPKGMLVEPFCRQLAEILTKCMSK